MFHIIWPLTTIGLSVFLVALEAMWLKTGDPDYYRHSRFWAKLFVLNFGIGVVSGMPLEFQFGTNWAPLSGAAGDFFGNMLGFEGGHGLHARGGLPGHHALRLEAGPPEIHFFSTCMVAFGASLSAFWIMVANSWMQTPAGGSLQPGARSTWRTTGSAIFNPVMSSGAHMWLACLETSLFVVAAISAWYTAGARHDGLLLRPSSWPWWPLVVAPLQVVPRRLSRPAAWPSTSPPRSPPWRPTGRPTRRAGAPWNILAWPTEAAADEPLDLSFGSLRLAGSSTTPAARSPGSGIFPRGPAAPRSSLLYIPGHGGHRPR